MNTNDRSTPEFTQLGGSISWLHSSGINVTLGFGTRDIDGVDRDPASFYSKVGYRWGMHAIAVEYGITEDLQFDNDESSNIGLAYVATPWKGVELYGMFRAFELDRSGVSGIEDLSQLMVGTRVKF